MKTSKKEVKKLDFYFTIISLIRDGKSPYSICSKFNISKQNAKYYINHLKRKNIIRKIGYGVWKIISKNPEEEVKTFSIGTRVDKPTTNLHALNIKFPILEGKIRDNDWQVKEKLNHWIPKYTDLSILGGLKLKNNNNKSITIYAKTRDIKSLNEVDNLAFKIRYYIYHYFKNQGVKLDFFNCEVKNLNLATEDKAAKGMIRKGEKFELDLNKKSEKIFSKDNIDAKALIDGSPFDFTAETNDKEWKREYLSMPFRILDMFRLLDLQLKNMNLFDKRMAYIEKNYRSHVGLVVESRKFLKKLNSKLSQEKLYKYI